MTDPRSQAPTENVVAGALLALLAIPVGVVLLALLESVGLIASIVGFAVAFAALWLYRRGSGGFVSRSGAWVVTAIVLVTLLLGIWANFVIIVAGGLGHLDKLNDPAFWSLFGDVFPQLLSENVLFVLLALAFGVLGSFRLLRRAFATAPVHPRPAADLPQTVADGPITPTTYRNDIDAPPTGSADDKLPPTPHP